ncbi:iron uptake protein [Panacagrimonas sp.]|uniref:iron uptake protein n=1 Tax=Panacagrimonas sp. TaxID=2480088 RepID=UPI003B5254DF
MSTHALPVPLIAARVAASLLGGYAFVWGLSTLAIGLAVKAGAPYGEAHTAVMLLAFLVFLWAFCWAFTAPRLQTVYAVLFGGGALTSALAWWLAGTLA